jgi:uncharacterized RDD family membrane protein YckC
VSTAGRIAFFPARVAARASRDQLALAADDLVPEVARLIDRAFASTLPEEVVQSAVRHKVVDRVARELVESGALDRAVNAALESEQMRRVISEVVESPEMRAALTRQTTGLAEELVGALRRRAVELDDRVGPAVASPFAGIATRAMAFAVDAAAVILIWVSLSAMVALISSLVGTLRPAWLVGLLLGSGFGLLSATYFLLFWSGVGQTPGMRLLHLRLLGPRAEPPSLVRSLVRGIATVISIVPLFAGYLPVLFDSRRRGLPDLLAGTVVVYEGRELESEGWAKPPTG